MTTDYALCVYDAGPPPRLVLSAAIPAGRLCGSKHPKSCWKSTKAGFRYQDAAGAAQGVHTILLQSGDERGKAKVVIVGKGGKLHLPPLSDLVPPLTVQVTNSAGRCWEAVHSRPAKFLSSQFKAKAD